MADRYQVECVRTLKSMGFYTDHKDDGKIRRTVNGKVTFAQIESGRADLIFVGSGLGGAVEVKTAQEGRYFYYDSEKSGWKPEQRKWSEMWVNDFKNPYYLWITYGLSVKDKKFPRMTLLVPRAKWMKIEDDLRQRECPSLKYDEARSMTEFVLEWAGDQRWKLPFGHEFLGVHNVGF